MHTKILNKQKELIGKEFDTNSCGKCFIIDYKGKDDVTVMFYSPLYVTKVRMGNLQRGKAVNKMFRSVYGVGYLSDGKFSKIGNENCYAFWSNMLGRAYGKASIEKLTTYTDVTVCEEWHNFQNFAEWFYSQTFSNHVDMDGCTYQLDKDILMRGNKVYSPETCCFVPQEINSLILKSEAKRGEHPIGVSNDSERCLFRSVHNVNGKQKFLGRFKTSEEAFQAYKQAKEAYIKEVAERWKGKIDDKVYQALLEWNIEITD